MKLNYIKFTAIATLLLANASCANAESAARQMQNQNQPAAGQMQQQQMTPEQYQQWQVYQQQLQEYYKQQQALPADNDTDYRLPGQYSPTLNDLRKQFPQGQPQQAVPNQSYQYNKKVYDQNDNNRGHESYYYQ